MWIPVQDGRNLARGTTAIYRCVQSGGRLHARISARFTRRKRRSPRWRSRYRSSTRFLEHHERLHVSESCCSENETVSSKGRFSDTSESDYVQRQTKTGIGVLHEATIDDYWNVDEDKSLSKPWIGVTRFELLNKNPPGGHMWV